MERLIWLKRIVALLILFVSVSLVPVYVFSSDISAKEDIVWRTQKKSENLNDAAYGKDTYVAVGDGGALLISKDGETWEQKVIDPYINFKSVSWNGKVFVAVGSNLNSTRLNQYTVFTSLDGNKWSAVQNELGNFNEVIYGMQRFIAAGGRKISVSTNAVNWTEKNIAIESELRGLACSGSVFIAVGTGGLILKSADGADWIVQECIPTVDFNAVTWGQNKFVAVGENGTIAISGNGNNWLTIACGVDDFLSVAYGKNRFIALGEKGIYISTDGVNWDLSGIDTEQGLNRVVFCNDMFIAAGNRSSVLSSDDGIKWNVLHREEPVDFLDIVWNGKEFVSVCKSNESYKTASSSDGVNWMFTGVIGGVPAALAYNNGTYVAVCTDGTIYSAKNPSMWTLVFSSKDMSFQDITYGNGKFMAIGKSGKCAWSNDGRAWVKGSCGVDTDLNSVRYLNQIFVACGARGTIAISSDGLKWVSCTTGVTFNLNDVAYGNSKFIAVGNDISGKILSSGDGEKWLTVSSNGMSTIIDQIKWDGSGFIGVGKDGAMLSSKDGLEWKRDYSGNSNKILGLACNGSKYMAVGFNSTVLVGEFDNQYRLVRPNPPKPDILPGDYSKEKLIRLSSDTPDVDIYYTLDGSVPDKTSKLYTEPIKISSGMTKLCAVSINHDMISSEVSENIYNITPKAYNIAEDYIKIISVSPSEGLVAGRPTNVTVKFEYNLVSMKYAKVEVGFNEGSSPDIVCDKYLRSIEKGKQVGTITAVAVPKKWSDIGKTFNIYVRLIDLSDQAIEIKYVQRQLSPSQVPVLASDYLELSVK